MSPLVDTNILLRIAQPNTSEYSIAAHAVRNIVRQEGPMSACPQTFYEFWSVATRPTGSPGNGLGLPLAEASVRLRQFEDFFPLLPDTPAVYKA